MFEEGTILYFKPFNFKNGATPKNKFFLVLGHDGDNLLLGALPTSKDHIPADLPVVSGAYEIPSRCLSAFVFLAGEIVTDNGYAFPKNTFVYGEQIDIFAIATFMNEISTGSTEIEVVGVLKTELFNNVKAFILNSERVRNKFKKLIHL